MESSRDTIGFPRDTPRGNLSEIPSNYSNKYPSQLTTIQPLIKPSYTPTNVLYTNPINIPSETLIRYPTGFPSSMPTEQPSSKPIYQSRSDPYSLNKESQETQVSLRWIIILFILHIILSLSSRKIATHTQQRGSLRISYIGAHAVYCDNRLLLSITK